MVNSADARLEVGVHNPLRSRNFLYRRILKVETMALPKFLQYGKSYAGKTIDRSKDTSSEIIDASQTSGSTINLGSGATTLTAGDYDTVTAGSGTDVVYSARGAALVTGSGADTFIFGVGSKPQSPGMIGASVVADCNLNSAGAYENNETIEISKSFLKASDLITAITAANNEDQGLVDQNGRTLTIDDKGDSITFLSGEKLDINHFKLV